MGTRLKLAGLILAALGAQSGWAQDERSSDDFDVLEKSRSAKKGADPATPRTTSPAAADRTGASAPERTPRVQDLRWGIVEADEAVVRNLFDRKGAELRRLPRGTVVRIHRRRGDWLLVEVPGGLPGWVYSDLLQPGDREGEFQVSADRVNFRPEGRMDGSYPLEPDRLHAGDRVLLLEKAGEWTRVLAPPEVRAWVSANVVKDTGDRAAAESEFQSQQLAYVRERVGETRFFLAKVEQNALLTRVEEALAVGDAQLQQELQKGMEADFEAVELIYVSVGEQYPGTEVDALVVARVEALKPHRAWVEGQRALVELQKREALARAEAEQLARETEQALRARLVVHPGRSPMRQRYAYFGWLRSKGPGLLGSSDTIVYELERGGRKLYKVKCVSGRYNLNDYVGREIAIAGDIVGNTIPPMLDIERIRILHNP